MVENNKLYFSEKESLDQNRRMIFWDTHAIHDLLQYVVTEDWENVREFAKPQDEHGITLVHLASYAGRLKELKQAKAAGIDLYIADDRGRCALHYAAAQGHVNVVKWFVEPPTPLLELQDITGKTALHLAVWNTRVDVVRILVNAQVDVNIRDIEKQTPLNLAWRNVNRTDPDEMSQYENIVDIILTSPNFERFIETAEQRGGWLALGHAILLNSTTATRQLLEVGLTIPKDPETLPAHIVPLHMAASSGFYKVLCLLLEHKQTSWMIDVRAGEYEHTPLHSAVFACKWNCAETLIKMKGNLLAKDKNEQTVISCLFQNNENPVAFLAAIMDSKVHELAADNLNIQMAHTIILSLDILAPREDQQQMAIVTALIANVSNMEDMYILQHPLMEAFLAVKWRHLRSLFLFLAAVQIVFVLLLVTYGMILLQTKRSSSVPAWILLVCACILLCHNALQFYVNLKYHVKQLETWLSLISPAICFIVVIAEELCFDYSMQSVSSWTIQSIGFAMLFTWIQMMFLIGRLSSWGNYALMFITVLKTVSKVFLILGSIIIGFSLSFLVLFHSNDDFTNPWKAFVKTVVMMTGDYGYSDLFTSTDEKNSSVDSVNSNKSGYTFVSFINSTNKKNSSIDSVNSNESGYTFASFINSTVFLVFITLGSIVVMNLITGLAVSDTQGILNEGYIRRFMKQAEWLNHLELVISNKIFENPRVKTWKLTSWLNSKKRIETTIMLAGSLTKCIGCPPGISKKLLKKLYILAAKNRHLHQISPTSQISSRNESKDSVTKTLQELNKLQKLQLEMMRIQWPQVLERRIVRRRKSATF